MENNIYNFELTFPDGTKQILTGKLPINGSTDLAEQFKNVTGRCMDTEFKELGVEGYTLICTGLVTEG